MWRLPQTALPLVCGYENAALAGCPVPAQIFSRTEIYFHTGEWDKLTFRQECVAR
jgi:hypothetical protein